MGGGSGGGSPAVRIIERVIEKQPAPAPKKAESLPGGTATTAEPGKGREQQRKKRGPLTSASIRRPGLTGGTDDKLGM